MRTTTRLRDERGLIGKIALVWLLLFALFVVAAVDVGSIALTRFKVSSAADDAAFQAAATFKDTKDRNQAYAAAVHAAEENLPGAKVPAAAFAIDPETGAVTVKVVKRAWSLLAGRLSFSKPYVRASATSTSEPPTL